MPKKAQDTTRLDAAIVDLENHIVTGDPDTDIYLKQVSTLEILYKLRDGHKPTQLELKDWMPIIGSLGGILIIVIFEAFGYTVVSKGLGFVSKLKS